LLFSLKTRLLNHNDLWESLIRIGNDPSECFDIIDRLHIQQPEGIMLYREETLVNLRREQMAFTVVIPFYEFTLCCPVHPFHTYDFDNCHDVGSIRHAKWRNSQSHKLQRQRCNERMIMDRWRNERGVIFRH